MQRTSQLISRWALASLTQSRNAFGTLASRTSGDIPQGHLNSDLSPNVCNIGLGRRRDLTLRSDLCLYSGDGQKTSLSHILKVLFLQYSLSNYLPLPDHSPLT